MWKRSPPNGAEVDHPMRPLSMYRATLRYLHGNPLSVMLSVAGRFRSVRSSISSLRRFSRPPSNEHAGLTSDLVEAVVPEDVASTLEADGVYAGLQLSANAHQLRQGLLNRTCYGEGRPDFPFIYQEKQEAEERYGRRFTLAHYYNLGEIDILAKLANDPLLTKIARSYFQAEPVSIGVRAWWSFASGASAEEQTRSGQSFHYDIDDYKALSIFFYLTEVDSAAGPHVCIRGSHKKKLLRHVLSPRRSRADDELLRVYGKDRITTMCGPAGFGFAEDTFCFHKGVHPQGRDRLAVHVRFAMHDYGFGSEETSKAWYGQSS